MSEQLFDLSAEYDSMLMEGVRLSGEGPDYFVRGRVHDLLPRIAPPKRILDFGCGIGHAIEYLSRMFPQAVIVGADTARSAVAHAEARYRCERISFCLVDELLNAEPFDLCYVANVFHHIPPPERTEAFRLIRSCVRSGGHLAIFENNPWNLGARMVMARIPFDRDAVMVSPQELRSLVRRAGFEVVSGRSLFYFPRALSLVRWLEPSLAFLPLGAQYWVLAKSVP